MLDVEDGWMVGCLLLKVVLLGLLAADVVLLVLLIFFSFLELILLL